MPITLLAQHPLSFVAWLAAILTALTVHEFSHAAASHLLGDQTAKRMGRLTLNPFAHLDPLGFAALVLVGFGWGKPVPFNPYNLRYPRWGSAMVAFAGPVSNLVSVLVFGTILKFAGRALAPGNLLLEFLMLLVVLNLVLFLFNLIPIPPLDGSKFLLSALSAPKYYRTRFLLETRGPIIILVIILLDNFAGVNILSHIFQAAIGITLRFFS
jgi:Zn-dependent protease